jgi:hypothetical protein
MAKETDEYVRDSDYIEALERLTDSAVAALRNDNRHCGELHAQIRNLQRQLSYGKDWWLTDCACCGREMLTTIEGNSPSNNYMEICTRCQDTMGRELTVALQAKLDKIAKIVEDNEDKKWAKQINDIVKDLK